MNARYFIERSALLTKCTPPLLGEGIPSGNRASYSYEAAPKNVFFFSSFSFSLPIKAGAKK